MVCLRAFHLWSSFRPEFSLLDICVPSPIGKLLRCYDFAREGDVDDS